MSDTKDTIIGIAKKIFLLALFPVLLLVTGMNKPELLAQINTFIAPAGISVIATTDTIGDITPQIEGDDVVPPEGGVTITTGDSALPNVTVKQDTPIETIEPAAQ